jgi:hypothetical protein
LMGGAIWLFYDELFVAIPSKEGGGLLLISIGSS